MTFFRQCDINQKNFETGEFFQGTNKYCKYPTALLTLARSKFMNEVINPLLFVETFIFTCFLKIQSEIFNSSYILVNVLKRSHHFPKCIQISFTKISFP